MASLLELSFKKKEIDYRLILTQIKLFEYILFLGEYDFLYDIKKMTEKQILNICLQCS